MSRTASGIGVDIATEWNLKGSILQSCEISDSVDIATEWNLKARLQAMEGRVFG